MTTETQAPDPAHQAEPDHDAWKCDRCNGDGWHWVEREGIEWRDKVNSKEHCELCDGLGWLGPDAAKAAEAELDKVLAEYRDASEDFDAEVLARFIKAHPKHADALRRYSTVQLTFVQPTREEIEAEEDQAHPAPDDWQHLKAYGYAPGGYMSRCRTCGGTPIMDKRAWRCRPCAEVAYAMDPPAAAIPAPEGAQAQWNDDRMVELKMLRQRVAMQRYELARLKGPNGKGAPAPQAPVALTRDQVEELFADGLGYEPKAVIVREIVAEFCRVNGIPAPKEPKA